MKRKEITALLEAEKAVLVRDIASLRGEIEGVREGLAEVRRQRAKDNHPSNGTPTATIPLDPSDWYSKGGAPEYSPQSALWNVHLKLPSRLGAQTFMVSADDVIAVSKLGVMFSITRIGTNLHGNVWGVMEFQPTITTKHPAILGQEVNSIFKGRFQFYTEAEKLRG